jgi:hypothetical protein
LETLENVEGKPSQPFGFFLGNLGAAGIFVKKKEKLEKLEEKS